MYLIIGDGRLSKHLQYYFSNLKIEFCVWSRKGNSKIDLDKMARDAKQIWIAVSDRAIEDFVSQLSPYNKPLIHSSGSLIFKNSYDAHLMASFGFNLFESSMYSEIPLVTSSEHLYKHELKELPNPRYLISPEQKALYHSLCVLAGPGSVTLWQKLMGTFDNWGIPPKQTIFYLKSITHNLEYDYKTALTGPWVRQDKKTIDTNLDSLKSDPFFEIMKSFSMLQEKIK